MSFLALVVNPPLKSMGFLGKGFYRVNLNLCIRQEPPAIVGNMFRELVHNKVVLDARKYR